MKKIKEVQKEFHYVGELPTHGETSKNVGLWKAIKVPVFVTLFGLIVIVIPPLFYPETKVLPLAQVAIALPLVLGLLSLANSWLLFRGNWGKDYEAALTLFAQKQTMGIIVWLQENFKNLAAYEASQLQSSYQLTISKILKAKGLGLEQELAEADKTLIHFFYPDKDDNSPFESQLVPESEIHVEFIFNKDSMEVIATEFVRV